MKYEPDVTEREYRDGTHTGIHAMCDCRDHGLLYYLHKHRLKTLRDIDSPALAFGRACHVFILEGPDVFNAQFIVRPNGLDGRTKAGKDWKKDAEASGKTVLSWEDGQLINQMYERVHSNAKAIELLATGVPEATFRGVLSDVKVQCRADWMSGGTRPNDWTAIVDLKTIDDIDNFHTQCARFNYLEQAHFYTYAVHMALGRRLPFYFIAIEKTGVHRCQVYHLDTQDYHLVDHDLNSWKKQLSDIAECQRNEFWPDGTTDDSIRAQIPEWKRRQLGMPQGLPQWA